MARTVRSPDGRTWTLERISQGTSFAERRQEPFFWPSLIATAIMLVFLVRLISLDAGWFTWVVIVPLFVIWLLERGLSFARPYIRAQTDGPARRDAHLADDPPHRPRQDRGPDRPADRAGPARGGAARRRPDRDLTEPPWSSATS
jgi:hypothetical protein